jgi:hypothetical protein
MATKKRKAARAVSAALPAGFVNTGSSDRAPAWTPEVGDSLQGTVMSVRSMDAKKAGRQNAKKGEVVRIMTVADADGVLCNVWESHALKDICDKAKTGDEIFLRLNAVVKRGKRRFKDFTAGLKYGKSKRK